ncbi:M50 family metallopeptidase [Spirilliplanes yamanashiensis]|uniref:Zinc metalloprotease n=1 Tax=Spirilliplanes yamanashiensis TaxID=42233 RepID=A0A8J3Y523_9ACTN|nr:site-2 protease family protein [Spirilliplanes yamanashiensis]MDP9819670.1 membrane-associated protease RseP (regulator of RpoE activity) [Spirilliplanes yamanashiensis]GIJ01510.1 zinc metalloprotease [Spirilliplanes yamanashiensis]
MLYALGVVGFALAILISVSLHEAGHMVTAKRFGMKVTRFFVGFGPTMFSFRRGETEYGVKWIPLGGFCKIVGMTPQDDDIDPEDEPRAMWRFPVWKRTIVMSAGSITHFALALVALWFAAAFVGLPNPDLPKDDTEVRSQPAQVFVGECVKIQASERPCAVGTGTDIASPAFAAGLRTNDVITQVGTTPVDNYGELTDTIRAQQPGPVPFTYVRDGQTGTATVTLVAVERAPIGDPDGPVQRVALAGVNWTTTKPAFVTYGATGAFPAVGDYAQQLVVGTFESLKKIPEKVPALWNSITGSERDPETPISVVGASRLGGEAIAAGLPQYFLMIFIALNVFIGIFNLLPLLPLDGGHIAIAWFERVRSWLYAKLKRPDPGRVDYFKLMPVTYAVILIGGAFTLLTVTADIVNPISIFR